MKFTRKHVLARAGQIRLRYHAGLLTPREIAQYETLPGWTWGTGARVAFKSFTDARAYVRRLHLTSKDAYRHWSKSKARPRDIPMAPWRTYRTEWISIADWLGKKPATTTVEQHVANAESLVKTHGKLPAKKWLNAHGYNGLPLCIFRYPARFKHINLGRTKQKPVAQHVRDAEALARKHGGTLPCGYWLKTHGHRALLYWLQRKSARHLFKHIKQDKRKIGGGSTAGRRTP